MGNSATRVVHIACALKCYCHEPSQPWSDIGKEIYWICFKNIKKWWWLFEYAGARSPALVTFRLRKVEENLKIHRGKCDFLGDFDWRIEVRFFKNQGNKFYFLGDFDWRIEVRFFKIQRKNVIVWVILSDELRCVFFKIQRKKNAPESPIKILKGEFFYWFWK